MCSISKDVPEDFQNGTLIRELITLGSATNTALSEILIISSDPGAGIETRTHRLGARKLFCSCIS